MTNRSSQIDSVFLSCIDTEIIQTKFGLRGKRGEPEDDTNAFVLAGVRLGRDFLHEVKFHFLTLMLIAISCTIHVLALSVQL